MSHVVKGRRLSAAASRSQRCVINERVCPAQRRLASGYAFRVDQAEHACQLSNGHASLDWQHRSCGDLTELFIAAMTQRHTCKCWRSRRRPTYMSQVSIDHVLEVPASSCHVGKGPAGAVEELRGGGVVAREKGGHRCSLVSGLPEVVTEPAGRESDPYLGPWLDRAVKRGDNQRRTYRHTDMPCAHRTRLDISISTGITRKRSLRTCVGSRRVLRRAAASRTFGYRRKW